MYNMFIGYKRLLCLIMWTSGMQTLLVQMFKGKERVPNV